MPAISLDQEKLTDDQLKTLDDMWRRCVRRIILSTTLAGSGHPGGSMSSLHLLLMLYSTLRHRPHDPGWTERDRLIVSMGHISPGVYAVLCEFGYIAEDAMLLEFRRAGSSFAGHVETCVPGVEWNTGNLGQGLSAATGMALALRLRQRDARVAALMGDGEQQKGQVSEARRFAWKYKLSNLLGIVDRNRLQIGGDTQTVMPQRIRDEYAASGWNVISVEDGHDYREIFDALRRVHRRDVPDPARPSVIVARTVMGKGISFMENNAHYHGCALTEDEAERAFAELGMENALASFQEKRRHHRLFQSAYCPAIPYPEIHEGSPREYGADVRIDNRSAYGAALEDLARLNNTGDTPKILGFSCDLEGSVKMKGFHKVSPDAFFEAGIQEHHTATVSGAVSREGFAVFFSTFGVFGVSEVYNQHRLNDINGSQLKLVCTHLGLDVGEDGQTHQCIDYIGLLQNLYHFSIFIPADPNQTDRIVRHAAQHPGNCFVGMGRSKTPVLTDRDGVPLYGGDYRFRPGRADWVRRGSDGAILAYGPMVAIALEAQRLLEEEDGLQVAVVNCASIKPLDEDAVLEAAGTGLILTVEDHHVETGLGARVAGVLADRAVSCRLVRLGVKHYGHSGAPRELYRMEGLDAPAILDAFRKAHAAVRSGK